MIHVKKLAEQIIVDSKASVVGEFVKSTFSFFKAKAAGQLEQGGGNSEVLPLFFGLQIVFVNVD
jgi:hypothetical protein